MGGEVSREELDTKVEAAYYRAISESKEEAKEEAQRREERANEERERLRDEFKKQRELDDLKRERIQAERLMEIQRLAEEKRHQELLIEKQRREFQEDLHQITQELQNQHLDSQRELQRKAEEEKLREQKKYEIQINMLREQARDNIETSEKQHKEYMSILKDELEENRKITKEVIQSLASLVEQFQQSKSQFSEYFQQKPQQDIETPEHIKETINKARRELGLDTVNYYNFAFVGHTKVGKSSLINAIRGMWDDEEGSAKVGITEATHRIDPYMFKDPKYKYVKIYDIPGAGTLSHEAGSYYEDKCLCAFDCLVILTQNTLGQEEIEFAIKSLKYNQPIAFVRSRCDIDLSNKKKLRQIKQVDQEAVRSYIEEMSQHYVAEILRTGNEELRKIPCFFISAFSLRDLILELEPEAIYQEPQFLNYMRAKSMFARNIIG